MQWLLLKHLIHMSLLRGIHTKTRNKLEQAGMSLIHLTQELAIGKTSSQQLITIPLLLIELLDKVELGFS